MKRCTATFNRYFDVLFLYFFITRIVVFPFTSIFTQIAHASEVNESDSVMNSYNALEAAYQQQKTEELSQMSPEEKDNLINYLQENGVLIDRITSLWTAKGIPRYLSGWDMKLPLLVSVETSEEAAIIFLEENKALFKMHDPATEMEVFKVNEGGNRYHVKMNQIYQGLPVFNAQVIIHFTTNYEFTGVNSRYVPDIDVSTQPIITSEEAALIAQENLEFESTEVKTTLGIFDFEFFLSSKKDPVLAWEVNFVSDSENWIAYIDANTGIVLYIKDNVENSLNRDLYTMHNDNDTSNMDLIYSDIPFCTNQIYLLRCSLVGWPADGTPVKNNAQTIYDYYAQPQFGRDGWDNNGGLLTIRVEYNPSDDIPIPDFYCNASWTGNDIMRLGTHLTCLEIMGHEYSHGIRSAENAPCSGDHSCSANESLSDISGEFIEGYSVSSNDWLYGFCNEDECQNGGIDMSDPEIDHLMRYDNCAAHDNRGVLDQAAYLLAVGGTQYTISVSGIGVPDSERIWYDTTYSFPQCQDKNLQFLSYHLFSSMNSIKIK